MEIKAVKFRRDGFYTQPFVFGGEEGPDKSPFSISVEPVRDQYNYIYRRTDLATLHGRHLDTKRNHIHRFRAEHPDFEYLPLMPECFRLVFVDDGLSTCYVVEAMFYSRVVSRCCLRKPFVTFIWLNLAYSSNGMTNAAAVVFAKEEVV